MEVNELRVGSIVAPIQMEDKYSTVSEIKQEFNDSPYDIVLETSEGMFVDVNMEDVKPLKITEDLLIGFGLEKQYMSYKMCISQFPNHERKWLIVDLFQGSLIRNGELDSLMINDAIISIHNVDKQGEMQAHQLQNLVFALTQTELKLK